MATAVDTLLQLLAPACSPPDRGAVGPRAGPWPACRPGTSTTSAWPVADPSLLVEDTVTLVVQVNGKVRDRIEVAADADEATCATPPRWPRRRSGRSWTVRTPRKVIVRAPKLVNIVL